MFRNKGIAFKLRLYILSGIIVIFSSILALDYMASRKVLMENARESAELHALSAVNKIESILKAAEKIPGNLAPIFENINYSEESIKSFLKPIVENNDEVFGSTVAFAPYQYDPARLYFAPYYFKTGDSVSYKILGDEKYPYFFLDWFQLPEILERPVWTEPYFDENGGNIIMSTYSVPFYKKHDKSKLTGIVTVDIDLTWLTQIIDSIRIFKTGYAFLISKNGTFITYPVDSLVINESIFSIAAKFNRPDLGEIGRKMIKGETGFTAYTLLNSDQEAWFYYTRLPVNDWSLGIIFPENELYADLHALFILLISLGLGGAIITFILITIISKRITKPVEELAAISQRIGAGNFDVPLPPIKGNDEIGKLTGSFEMMKKELKTYIQNLEVTTAAKNKIESELKIAHDIQQGIIPKIFPPFPDREDVDLFAILDPAREVGGDLYDFFFLDKKTLVFVIGDVSGKGVPASLFMAITRTLFRAKAVQSRSASQIVGDINHELCIDNENAMFVTFFLGLIDLETGDVEFCNAGHNYPYILRKNNTLEKLSQTHGTPLGLFDDIQYKTGHIKLERQETIVLYTDGIPEAMDINDDLFGDPKLEKLLKEVCCQNSPKDITLKMLEETRNFALGAEQSDDITILVLTYYLAKMNKNKQEKLLKIKNTIDEIQKVEMFIEQLCGEWEISVDDMHKVNLAMEEIISNIINYGYDDDKEHQIMINAGLIDDTLKFTIEDDAKPFNPLEQKDPDDINKPIEERNIGGLGIFFVKKLMDKVEYRYEGNHNILIIEKIFTTPQ